MEHWGKAVFGTLLLITLLTFPSLLPLFHTLGFSASLSGLSTIVRHTRSTQQERQMVRTDAGELRLQRVDDTKPPDNSLQQGTSRERLGELGAELGAKSYKTKAAGEKSSKDGLGRSSRGLGVLLRAAGWGWGLTPWAWQWESKSRGSGEEGTEQEGPGTLGKNNKIPAQTRQRRELRRVFRPLHQQQQQQGGAASMTKASRRKKKAPGFWGGAVSVPTPPTTNFFVPFKQLKGKGPCKRVSNPLVIKVNSFQDMLTRLNYPTTTSVVLEFHSGFVVPRGLVLAGNFSCTFLLAAKGKRPLLSTTWSTEPVLTIHNTSNILMNGISIRHGITSSAQPCSFYLFQARTGAEKNTLTCPGLYIIRSYGIQITRGSVYGRIDVFRSIFVKLDSLDVTTAEDAYDKAKPYRSTSTMGIIRMGLSDLGPRFLATNNIISNCEVYGGWKLITIYQGVVGVTLRNNNLHHFYMAAIQCGAYDGNTFDCHNNYFGYNHIWNPQGWGGNSTITAGDNAGIYTFIHWYNPNNYITCNYIEEQKHCIYLDSASSGVVVDGGVCYNSYVGIKVNNGKYNRIRNVIVVSSSMYLSYITCITAQVYIYPDSETVRMWEGVRRGYYDTPEINKAYPWMKSLLNPVPSSYNGVECNPSGGISPEKTGHCSGLAYANYVETYAYNPPVFPYPNFSIASYWGFCENIPSMPKLNTQLWHNVTAPGFKFKNPKKLDFGLRAGSPLAKKALGFKACPRKSSGKKRVYFNSYLVAFNIPRPDTFDSMLNFTTPPRVILPL